MYRESSLNRERILRAAPSPDGQGTVVLVEALLTDDEVESIDGILSALARRQHPLGEQINQRSLDDRLILIDEFHRDRRGRSRSPRTIPELTSESLETPEPSPGAYTRGEERSDDSVPSPRPSSPAAALTTARASTDPEPVALSARLTNALRDRSSPEDVSPSH